MATFYERVQKKLDNKILAKHIGNSSGGSSVSDDGKYPIFCKVASQNGFMFNHFRRNEIYNLILDHLSFEQGQQYLDELKKKSGFDKISERISEYVKNDTVGSPRKYVYNIGGREVSISPTTLRYIKVLYDLKELFDMDSIKSVAEIGVGYGGQFRIISADHPMNAYYLIDLPEPLMLAKRYTGKFAGTEAARFVDGTTIKDSDVDSCDLVMSNYAYSELVRVIQDSYFKKVIKKARHGYLTWNLESERKMDGYTVKEFTEKLEALGREVKILEEHPLTAEGNCLIVW
ncbi:putative sugar O-methyltransferase [Butyrivibrio sp. VCD2006]|uniref:putative sugar O-methyltransferase n=1 Tax=Butyrivibrio sp. VCD2006 TaxID=1280664 RepID=UPI0018CA2A17|nr:putative sugar O-methyltransferase [Butyrivibrio sp. VCD2006]